MYSKKLLDWMNSQGDIFVCIEKENNKLNICSQL